MQPPVCCCSDDLKGPKLPLAQSTDFRTRCRIWVLLYLQLWCITTTNSEHKETFVISHWCAVPLKCTSLHFYKTSSLPWQYYDNHFYVILIKFHLQSLVEVFLQLQHFLIWHFIILTILKHSTKSHVHKHLPAESDICEAQYNTVDDTCKYKQSACLGQCNGIPASSTKDTTFDTSDWIKTPNDCKS